MSDTKEFKTIHNMISEVIGVRFHEGQFRSVYAQLNRVGSVDDILRDHLLVALVNWAEQHEKECSSKEKSATV